MKRLLFLALLVVLISGCFLAYRAYQMVQAPNIAPDIEEVEIKIADESTFEDLLKMLEAKSVLSSLSSFKRVARWMDFSGSVPPGNYLIKSGMSNRQVINIIRSGSQSPVTLTINNARVLADVAGKIAAQIASDSLSILEALASDRAKRIFETSDENIMSYLIPNTYQVFWDIRPEDLLERLKTEHKTFWEQNDRLAKAAELGMSLEEVYTLASVVEKETLRSDELPVVAGLYLNRLKRGMLLQADPTVVFALGQFDLRRVLYKHLTIDSPYNTYKYAGLPPGPICMPRILTIDAVLNAENHDYIYMCAKAESGGRHAFAANEIDHGRNARAYQSWLNEQGIR